MRSAVLLPDDVTVDGTTGIPRTRTPWTLECARTWTPHQVANACYQAELKRGFDRVWLDELVVRVGRRPGSRGLRQAISLRERRSAGTRSPYEDQALEWLPGLGWRGPEVNVRFEFGGETYELDFADPVNKWNLEVDGAHHELEEMSDADRDADATKRRHGWTTARVRTRDMRRYGGTQSSTHVATSDERAGE